MERHQSTRLLLVGALLLSLAGGVRAQEPVEDRGPEIQAVMGTAFTYQGYLTDGGSPAEGSYDFKFMLYDVPSEGAQVGSTVVKENVAVADGYFTVMLDFGGAAFNGQARYLAIAVRPASSTGDYTALSPRQSLTPSPYALYARTVGSHDHLGDTWSGGDNPLVIEGSFTSAPLELSNEAGNGLHVGVVGGDGVNVHSAGQDGVHVHSAGSPTTASASISKNGFEVNGAEGDGLFVGRADLQGVRVLSAGDDGVHVWETGRDGVRLWNAGGDGLHVNSAGSHGVFLGAASQDGVYVGTAGSPSTTNQSTDRNGLEVAGAEGHGLYVGRADLQGVLVNSAGGDGVALGSTGGSGVSVGSAGADGLSVQSASNDGVHVGSAGYSGVHVGEVSGDGLSVDLAGGAGLYVGGAAGDGVYVDWAGDYAGYFNGRVHVNGALSKSSGSFKIDHPLDPENRYLNHSFVESPDMMNVYNGNVTTDEEGYATVRLPDYFEALNRDYRYQLTVIGTFARAIIAQEVVDGEFVIQTDQPHVRVSWQVTGIRQDPWAEANPIVVEEDKPADEQGTYLHPEVYGLPEERGLAYKEAREREAERPQEAR